jgi:pyrrolidone-carboxylate peptidase
MTYNLRVKGNITTKVGGTTRIYAKEGVERNSNKSIRKFAENYTYGEPDDPPKRVHPDIVSVQFLDENNSVLKQETIAEFGGIKATNVLYGKKIKIKIVTKEVADGTKIEFAVKGNSKKESQKFLKIDVLKWNLEIQNNACETDLFRLSMSWYNEDYEFYDYNLHKTNVKTEDLNTFTIKGFLCLIPFELLNDEDELKPIAYLRNYEELIGLFKTNNSGEKTLIDNCENKFINYNPEIFKIESEFSDYLSDTDNLTLTDIKARIKTDAKKLWDTAVKQVQTGNLDDRPLYWARNKMQVSLKRNPVFEKDINFETSTVNKDSELEKIIQIFEEESRNYTNIDFRKANGKKKVLITGFDPFFLNSINHNKYKENSNILQSNPSGVIALAFANNYQLEAYIQTIVVPVRYTDFDGSPENNVGQGEGIIEKYIKPFINEVDMIITISQAGEGDYHIDLFATATRKGLNDNMDFIRIDKSSSVSNNAPETIKTTLPIQMTLGESKAIYWGEYFLAKQDEIDYYTNDDYSKKRIAILDNYPTQKVYSGPGGNYLSNEIFYRVAKMRNELKPKLKTGHFHVSMIQPKGDLNSSHAQELLDIVSQTLKEGFKTL